MSPNKQEGQRKIQPNFFFLPKQGKERINPSPRLSLIGWFCCSTPPQTIDGQMRAPIRALLSKRIHQQIVIGDSKRQQGCVCVCVERGGARLRLSVSSTVFSCFDVSTIKVFFIKETYTYTSMYTRTHMGEKGRENQGILCFGSFYDYTNINLPSFILADKLRPPPPSPTNMPFMTSPLS